MQQLDRDEVSTVIAAPPKQVYDLVADVTRTPEFSPEIVSCRWLDGATGPAVGARFEAVNRNVHGRNQDKTWKNRPVVRAADRGREFAFTRTEPFAGTITWQYHFEPVEGGTRVTESYEVERPVARLGWLFIERVYGVTGSRREQLRAGMQTTLQRLKVAAEQRTTAPS